MRTCSTLKALLALITTLTIAGCSPSGTTENQPGTAGDSSKSANPTLSPTPRPPESESGAKTTQVPSIEVVSQQADVSDELGDKLENTSPQFNNKDFSLTLIPVAGHNKVETGSVKFAVDSSLPPSCMDVEGGEGSGPCVTLFLITTSSSEATNGRDVISGYPAFFKLDKDVGKSVLKIEIPDGASKAFASVVIGDKSSMINVETGDTTEKFGPVLP